MEKPKISEEEAKRIIEEKAKSFDLGDLEQVIKRQKELEEKLKGVPGTLGKFFNRVKLLFEMVKDYWNGTYKEIPWFTVAMAGVAIVYFLSPIDIIPDFIPVIGYIDDAIVIAACIFAIEEDLRKYCAFKGYNPVQYF